MVEGGGGDAHWIGVSHAEGKLYELFALRKEGGRWLAGSGAIFDLATGERVPGWQPGWTSADAAGLPILPGLLRADEFAKGEINHAIRVTVGKTRRAFVAPATHWASSDTSENLLPMGARLRLKASIDEGQFAEPLRPLIRSLKRHGTIICDNGSPSFVGLCGTPDSRWDDLVLAGMKAIKAGDFEVVRLGELTVKVD